MKLFLLLIEVHAQLTFLDQLFPIGKTTESVAQSTSTTQPTNSVFVPYPVTSTPVDQQSTPTSTNKPVNQSQSNQSNQPSQSIKSNQPKTKNNENTDKNNDSNDVTFTDSSSNQNSSISVGAQAGLLIGLICLFAAGVAIYAFRTYGLQVISSLIVFK